jgi:hypothetical protein
LENTSTFEELVALAGKIYTLREIVRKYMKFVN